MKMARSYKITLLIVAFIAAIAFAFGFMNLSSAKADVSATSYVSYVDKVASSTDIVFDDDSINVKLYDGVAAKLKNQLAVNDFELKFKAPDNADKLDIIFTIDAFDVNGNVKIVDGKVVSYDKKIDNVLTLDFKDNKVVYQGVESAVSVVKGASYVIKTEINSDGKLAVLVNGSVVANEVDTYYKVENVDKTLANISFKATYPENNVGGDNLELISFDQKTTDANHKFLQEIKPLKNGGIDGEFIAEPLIEVSENFFAEGNTNHVVELGRKYTLTIKGSSFYNTFSAAEYTITSPDADVIVEDKTVVFTAKGNRTIEVKKGNEVVETYAIKVEDEANDTAAPKYNDDQKLAISFNEELQKLVKDAKVGSNQYLTLKKDMFKSMVSDDYTAFNELTCKIYYASENKTGNVSNMKIPLTEAGHYSFYATFTDHAGNETDIDNFYYYDINGVAKYDAPYSAFIFQFDIVDESSLVITASKPGTGYVGTKYNATSFDIDASFTYTDTYKLYYTSSYNAENPDASEWVEITASSAATNEEKDYNGYTYDQIKSIAYDGKLSFTPDKTGFYKIQINVTSSSSTKSDTEEMVIEVKDVVKTVKVDTKWLQNNVWSVVFLSVGTVCLIVVIVLLFIKPKDEDEDIDFDKIAK